MTHEQREARDMRAVVQDRYGEPEAVLRMERVPVPAPSADEVLIRVRAAGVGRAVLHLVTGRPHMLRLMGFGLRRPRQRIPGRDVAGTVIATGSSVTGFAVGDEVFGFARGAFAETACARADRLAHRPPRIDAVAAATIPDSATTALQALRDAGRVREGQRVLVIGASGGVGTAAVQLARSFGAHVTGVCSQAKADLVRSLGAERVIAHDREDVTAGSERYDLILDIGGGTPVRRLRRVLGPRGTLVMVGSEAGGRWTGGIGRQLRALALSPLLRQRFTMLVARERGSDLEALAALMRTGEFVPCLERALPLESASDALRALDAGAVRGKLALVTDPVFGTGPAAVRSAASGDRVADD